MQKPAAMLLAAVALAPACGPLPTETAGAGNPAISLATATAGLPAPVRNYYQVLMPGFPAVTQSMWRACLQLGQVNLVGVAYGPGLNCRLVFIDGYPRRFVVYVPPTLPQGTPTPVVLMHHGSTGTGEQFVNISGWVEEANAQGFVAVFPTALEYLVLSSGRISTKWNGFRLVDGVDLSVRPPGYSPTAPWPARDSAFVDTILDDLEGRLAVDRHRIYASGFSSGGNFTARLAIELSDRLAAVGMFAGELIGVHQPKHRIPVASMVGSLDDRMLEGVNAALLPGQDSIRALPLVGSELLAYAAIQGAMAAVTGSFDLDPTPNRIVEHPLRLRLRWSTPLPGNTDRNVFGYAVLDGVIHHYPHLGSPRAKNPHGFSAAQLFWRFFEQHPKP